ncbi:protein of unknown function [Ruminococcaceae bacterium BL-6]|nr:protein of unknown function [Ruminococcaceae bacterium BL-6]
MALKNFEKLGFKAPGSIILQKNGITVLIPTNPNDKDGYCIELNKKINGHNLCFYMLSEQDALEMCEKFAKESA